MQIYSFVKKIFEMRSNFLWQFSFFNSLPQKWARVFKVPNQCLLGPLNFAFCAIDRHKNANLNETDVNKQGLECLRLLNEIICDFDKVNNNSH